MEFKGKQDDIVLLVIIKIMTCISVKISQIIFFPFLLQQLTLLFDVIFDNKADLVHLLAIMYLNVLLSLKDWDSCNRSLDI